LVALGGEGEGLRRGGRGRRRSSSRGRRRRRDVLKTRVRQLDRRRLVELLAGGRDLVLRQGDQAQRDTKVLPGEVMLLAGVRDGPNVLQNPHIQPRELEEVHRVQALQLTRGPRVGNREKLVIISLFIGCGGGVVTGVGRRGGGERPAVGSRGVLRLRRPRRRRPAGRVEGHEGGVGCAGGCVCVGICGWVGREKCEWSCS